MTFAVVFEYAQDPEKIARVRPTHREYIQALKKNGQILVAGPFVGDAGGLLVYEAETPEQVETLIQGDPFCKEGVFSSWVIRPWKIVALNPSAFPVI